MISDAEIQRVIGRRRTYLDLLSVVEHVRSISLIAFIRDPSKLNRRAGTRIPPLPEQRRAVREYLNRTYKLVRASPTHYFVTTRESIAPIALFIATYSIRDSTYSNEAAFRSLSSLLEYPECCVHAHFRGRSDRSANWTEVIPFRPCSQACGNSWLGKYITIAERHGINLSERYLR